jgi:hypothetical protein
VLWLVWIWLWCPSTTGVPSLLSFALRSWESSPVTLLSLCCIGDV